MVKKRKFEFEEEMEVVEDGKKVKKVKKDIIEHDDGAAKCKHNGAVPTDIKDNVNPPSGYEAKKWLLSNPQYWWKDSHGIWHCYCWGGSTC